MVGMLCSLVGIFHRNIRFWHNIIVIAHFEHLWRTHVSFKWHFITAINICATNASRSNFTYFSNFVLRFARKPTPCLPTQMRGILNAKCVFAESFPIFLVLSFVFGNATCVLICWMGRSFFSTHSLVEIACSRASIANTRGSIGLARSIRKINTTTEVQKIKERTRITGDTTTKAIPCSNLINPFPFQSPAHFFAVNSSVVFLLCKKIKWKILINWICAIEHINCIRCHLFCWRKQFAIDSWAKKYAFRFLSIWPFIGH